ncbi:MAG: sensor histidine kinase [Solirubrobacterales bacterium]|nr:sensor histidine kinase [Solirubrobacterales bacterium]
MSSTLLAVAAAGMSAVVAALVLTAAGGTDDASGRAVVQALVVAVPIATGMYALRNARTKRFGTLLIVAGVVWSLTALSESSSSLGHSTGRVAGWLVFPALVYLMLSFPQGRLLHLRDRALFWGIASVIVVLFVSSALVVDAYPRPSPWSSCREDCPPNAFQVLPSEPAFFGAVVAPVRDLLSVAMLLGVSASLVVRLREASTLRQVTIAPVLAVSIVTTLTVVAFIVLRRAAPDAGLVEEVGFLWTLCLPALAAAFSLGLIQRRLVVSNVLSALTGVLGTAQSPAQIAAALRHTIGDPSVEVLLWDRDHRRWHRDDGALVPAADVTGPGRTLRELGDRDGRLAGVVFDVRADVDDELVASVLALGEAALREARLKADLETSLIDLDDSRQRIATAADVERRRIERDLHDGAQQRLIALRMRLALAEDLLRDDPDGALEAIQHLGDDVDATIDEIRALAHGIYPALLADRGLADALRGVARRLPMRVDVRATGLTRHSPQLESAVYFSCVEALQNVVKHAGDVTRTRVTFDQGRARLAFDVADDGDGFDAGTAGAGAGMRNMRDRVESLGGTLSIRSAPGRGTTVSGLVPLGARPSSVGQRMAARIAPAVQDDAGQSER